MSKATEIQIKNEGMKASDIIKKSCCGNLLDVDKDKLVEMVKDLESQVVFLEHRLSNAMVEIQKRGKR